jgi:hypothetical protein
MFGVAVQEGLIDPERSIQIGIRTPSPPSPKLNVLTADRCLRMDGKAIAKGIDDHWLAKALRQPLAYQARENVGHATSGPSNNKTDRPRRMRWPTHVLASQLISGMLLQNLSGGKT